MNFATADLYKIFSRYKVPKRVIHRECGFCFTFEDEEYLLKAPLEQLNHYIFGAWSSACNIADVGEIKHKYFIPRILELLLVEDVFIENIHAAIGKFHYKSTFSVKEIATIDAMFTLYLEKEFADPDYGDPSEIFGMALTGFDCVAFLGEQKNTLQDWPRIREELLKYASMMKAAPQYNTDASEQWLSHGHREQVWNFLVKSSDCGKI
tara:strand:- start:1046 stop:1669 length:624 start_codon:yes stop_codon:yes gene_type:complete